MSVKTFLDTLDQCRRECFVAIAGESEQFDLRFRAPTIIRRPMDSNSVSEGCIASTKIRYYDRLEFIDAR